MHHTPALLGEFVDQASIIGTRVGALLLRARDVAVGFTREETESVDQVVETAATKRMDVVRRQVSITNERLQYFFDVALGEHSELGLAAFIDDGSSSPTRVALPGKHGVHCQRNGEWNDGRQRSVCVTTIRAGQR